jgi:hypothetical protein
MIWYFVKTMVLAVLHKFAFLDFHLGTSSRNEKLLGYCILDWETLTAICFSKISSSRLYQLKKFMGTLDQTDLQTITE